MRKAGRWILSGTLGVAAPWATALADEPSNTVQQRVDDQQLIHRQEQQRALEQQFMPDAPDVRFQSDASQMADRPFPEESPCFVIRDVHLSGLEALPARAQRDAWRQVLKAHHHCLGEQGINQLTSDLQDMLIERGWITTRVLIPDQDLSGGTLQLEIVPGRVGEISRGEGSTGYVTLSSAMPVRSGDLLDLRDVEQGLENLQRLPSVSAKVELVPGEQVGESDLVITRKQTHPVRFGAWLDDSGSNPTGLYQGGVMLAVDNPFSLSDLFYVTLSHDLSRSDKKHSRAYSAHYSVPYGYWLFGVTASDDDYYRTLASNRDVRYSGERKSLNLKLTRLLQRGTDYKTSMTAELLTRQSRNYTSLAGELGSQHRNTSAWRLGLTHRRYFGETTWDVGATYQRGIRGFGAHAAPEESSGEATAMAHIIGVSSQLNVPFTLGGQSFRYLTQYQFQRSNTPLTPQDQFAIGGRWTVRGFDGERLLSADGGWYWRNEVAWRTPWGLQELYAGIDHGEALGYSTYSLPGRQLTGAVVGVRGLAFDTSYDLFAGTPIRKPAGFETSSVTLGMSLSWQY